MEGPPRTNPPDMRDVAGFVLALVVLGSLFTLLERLFPSIPNGRFWSRSLLTDLAYWIARPLLFKPLTRLFTVLPVAVLALLLGVSPGRASITEWVSQGHGPMGRLPLGIQFFLALFTVDFIGYWSHRWFHKKALWRFHAVHHAMTELTWRSSVRVHPVNEIVNHTLHALVLVGLGFRVDVLVGVVPFLSLYAILLHANVPWSFGPLRYAIASPVFHRFHHTSAEEGLDKNFAGLFPLWDVLFGTFHMPRGQVPTRFGVIGEQVPEGFWKQLVWPFVKPTAARPKNFSVANFSRPRP